VGFAERLKQVIDQTGLSQQGFADRVGLSAHSVSRYVTGGQAPDAPAMIKLAKALPGLFEWILTGVRPTELAQQRVGSLPPQLRDVVTSAECLSTADHETMALLACILGQRQRNPKLVHALVEHIEGVSMAMEEGQRRGDAHPPQVPSSANPRTDQSE
jgi:transcriptional regulator with XRE-family HTH domain